MRVVLLGPPGVGKGTQAAFLVARLRVPHVSTGDLLREAIRRGAGPGAEAKALVAAGKLVPDRVVRQIVEDRLGRPDCRGGFVLDGYPRNLRQADELDEILAGAGARLDRAAELTLDEETLVRRLAGRRTCRRCGTVFHVEFHRPPAEGICERCGGELFQREDDREEVIRERLRVYRESTEPLATHYRRRGILVSVDAGGPVEDVAGRLASSLGLAA